MARPAVEFDAQGTKLHLVYRPDIRDPEHLRKDLAAGKSVTIKGTYHLTQANLFQPRVKRDPEDFRDDDGEMRFVVAKAEGNYFVFDPAILNVKVRVMVTRKARPTWKWFTAEKRTSVVRLLAELRPSRIVIGGDLKDAIPIVEYEKLVGQFPSSHEMQLYVRSRLGIVFRELTLMTRAGHPG